MSAADHAKYIRRAAWRNKFSRRDDLRFVVAVDVWPQHPRGLAEELREYLNVTFQEIEMLIANFSGERITITFSDDTEHFEIFSDYGYGFGKSLKSCMHRWVNIDDEADHNEFAIRSRALGSYRKKAEIDYLPELRSFQCNARGLRFHR